MLHTPPPPFPPLVQSKVKALTRLVTALGDLPAADFCSQLKGHLIQDAFPDYLLLPVLKELALLSVLFSVPRVTCGSSPTKATLTE
jgi:hypothetical protein